MFLNPSQVGFSKDVPMEDVLSALSKVIIPVNWPIGHWLVVVLDFKEGSAVFMDSLREYTGTKGRREVFDVNPNPYSQFSANKLPVGLKKNQSFSE